MTTKQDVTDLIRRQPFIPFTIVTASGKDHQVRHPEAAAISLNGVIVTDPSTQGFAIVPYAHISALESHLPATS